MKIAVAQINTTVGDFAGNAETHPRGRRRRPRRGRQARRHARDGALRISRRGPRGCATTSATAAHRGAGEARRLLPRRRASSWAIPHREGRTRYNAAALLRGGRIEHVLLASRSCPTTRSSTRSATSRPGNRAVRVRARRRARSALTDLRGPLVPGARGAGRRRPARSCCSSINASPFHRAQQAERYQRMGARVKETKLPLLYVHGVGGQDELVLRRRLVRASTPRACSPTRPRPSSEVDRRRRAGTATASPARCAQPLTEEELIYRALVTGACATT